MTPFDFVNSISYNKKNLFNEEPEQSQKDYAPYIVNKALTLYPDCLFYANEMNRLHHLLHGTQSDQMIRGWIQIGGMHERQWCPIALNDVYSFADTF